MRKFTKTMIGIASICAMLSAACMPVSAAYNTKSEDYADTTDFVFTKHYNLVEGGDSDNAESPAENFNVLVSSYKFFNVPASANMTVDTMPKINNIGLSAKEGDADNDDSTNVTLTISLPDYTYVGDYWYELQEVNNNIAGVTYDANKYYLHVQVLNNSDLSGLIRLITLHSEAPDEKGIPVTDTKNDGITNIYSNGSLSVNKKVIGNMGDKHQTYQITVNFESDKEVKSDVKYDSKSLTWTKDDESNKWTSSATVDLAKDATVTFVNIPYGVTYTITEKDYSADGYTHKFEFKSADENEDTVTAQTETDWTVANAKGIISDAADEVIVTNEKDVTIDVGVILENAPYAILFVLATAGLTTVLIRKRKNNSNE